MAKQRPRPRHDSGKPGFVLWLVVGVVALVALVMLARTLSSSAPEPQPIPTLSTVNPDLAALTRMLGDIELVASAAQGLPTEVNEQLAVVDSLIKERSWHDAIGKLRGLLKSAPRDWAGPLRAYLGFCFYQAASPDHALAEFGKALAGPEEDSSFRAAVDFQVGYLYQSRGFPDSAIAHYLAAQALLGDSADPLLPWLLNNIGVARESRADTAGALESYLAAARQVDTAAEARSARTLRDNIRRLTPR